MTDGRLSKSLYSVLSEHNEDEGLQSLLNIPISNRRFIRDHSEKQQWQGRGRHSRESSSKDYSAASSSHQNRSVYHQVDSSIADDRGERNWRRDRNENGSNESSAYKSGHAGSTGRNCNRYRGGGNQRSSRGIESSGSKFGSNTSLSSEFSSSAQDNGDFSSSHVPARGNRNNPIDENKYSRENKKPFWKRLDEDPGPSKAFMRRNPKDDNSHDGENEFEDSSSNKKHRYQKNNESRGPRFGYKYLEQLSTKEDHEIIVEITKAKSPFDSYLSNDSLKPDWLFLMLNIIRKVCLSDFKGNRSVVLDKLCKSKFLTITSTYLGDVTTEENPKTKANLPKFIDDLSEFYSCVLNTLPSLALEKDLKKLILKTRVSADNISKYLNVNVDEKTVQKLQTLDDKFNDYMALVKERLPKENVRTYLDRIAECAPPEDFRELSLYPTYEDIARPRLGFVRPNIVSGAYGSVEHYLDIQFRLMREDFIDPLRTGLRKYLESKSEPKRKSKFKYDNVRLYPGTRFENIENSKTHQVGILLNFDPQQKMKRFSWERSKRFMHGSLLMFTTDDFQTFFYGTVLERDMNLLKTGKILIALTVEAKTDKNFFNTPFLMAESEVFFEPYFLIMKLLKELNEETFPMKQYIVKGQSQAEKPDYLYSFHELYVGQYICDPLDTTMWPSAASLGLDTFQYLAYKSALTRSFCVIQGPPGTGKTFLGLKIVETIRKNALHNNKLTTLPADWRTSDTQALRLPILIVCYTNHALDQFLEGMLKFTNKIVRIGGQSRSEVMQNYNLRGRNNLSQLRKHNFTLTETMYTIRLAIKTYRQEIERINQEKKSTEQPIGILRLSVLQKVMNPSHSKFLASDDDLQMWLLASGEDDVQAESEVENFNSPSRQTKEKEEQEEIPVASDDEFEEEDRNIVNEDDIFWPDENSVNQLGNTRHYSMTVDELGSLCSRKIDERREMKLNERSFIRDYSEYHNQLHALENDILQLLQKYNMLKNRLENPNYDPRPVKFLLLQHPQTLAPDSRWILYWHWISQLRDHFAKRMEQLEAEHRNKMTQYEEYKQLEDLHVVKQADIVGMTTTGAARFNLMLKSLQPAVVVVEEAAEVLEAHIVASLTHKCQHVILIGDHEQLKPSTAVYELSRKYNIDVSLFERMIKNGMDCPMLNVQHRMRPEISCLITPLIYPNLKNHESVLEFDSIKGVKKNVFFINHNEYEQILDENQTKQNIHEAQFMISLARYLVQQGYNPENITVLTTYTGQMFLLRQLKKENFLLNFLKCVVVDKYQGEENEIILLSLVRSNAESKIGFLNIKNRVCVALSRAKKGLYIMGNMDCLTKSSELWVSIKKTLEENKAIGNALELYCSKHDNVTSVASSKDFDLVKEGGCNEFCHELMACGHTCPSMCHILNQNHEDIKCREPCRNTCPRNHPCRLFCYEKCQACRVPVEFTLPCHHVKRLPCHTDEATYLCDVIVDDVSPICKHAVKRKCHQKVEDVPCSLPCTDRLDCGHACTRTCHKNDDPDHTNFKCKKPCEQLNKNCSKTHVCQKLCFEECGQCSVKIPVKLNCGHEITLQCSADLSNVKCFKKCEKHCDQCEQRCRKKCWEDCRPCQFMMKKTIPECGHTINVQCSVLPSRERCNAKCENLAPCGHRCKSMCCKPCGSDKCMEMVKIEGYPSRPLCGHPYIYVFCYQKHEVPYMNPKEYVFLCQEPCNALLECGDPCGGSCGECWQGRLHKTCNKKCGSPLICGHICKFPCRQLCPPCNEPCTFICKHSRCPKKCGVPCASCKEPCEWMCKHSRCTKKCGDLCNREPCMEPCPKKLAKCGHDCIGFCGEPCPPLCRICDPEVTEIMFGYEDEPDARFVLLEDCNHTIESQALDQHLSTTVDGGEIVLKVCPLCKTPIKKTLRYMNFVKETYIHIMNVKNKIFGENNQIKTKKQSLIHKLQQLNMSNLRFFSEVDLEVFLVKCLNKMSSCKNNQISQRDLSAITYYCEVFSDIISRKEEFGKQNEFSADLFEFVGRLLRRLQKTDWCINRQFILDFGDEIRRYHKLVDFCKLIENPLFIAYKNDGKVSSISSSLRNALLGTHKFNQPMEETVLEMFRNLEKELKSPKSLTSEEKRMINEAMKKDFHGGSSGHWFTCSNGHYYVITECGGAMQRANCPECGEVIGGSNHTYVSTARLASDMDGATRPAWSSGHNMANYVLN